MEAAVLRVKRKRGADPAEALLISCKRSRTEEEAEEDPGRVSRQLFRLAATVTSQDEPIQKYVHEALSRDRAAQAFNPTLGSLHRVQKDLRAVKETERQESRYRLISNLRPKCDDESGARNGQPASPVTDQTPVPGKVEAAACGDPDSPINAVGSFQVFDMVHEETEKEEVDLKKSDPETITCNSVEMIREHLTVSDEGLGSEHRENPDEFVYDIYYAESAPQIWIQDILSVQPYSQQQEELMPEDPEPEEVYDDEDDENEESNWRNDYPDEDDENDSDREERYMGYYEDSEEDGHRGDSWKSYSQKVMRELDEEDECD
ncbi:PREDICTED: probable RNA polymerase II nuclear localization protein SLC7A6OS [Nanorana parkeri]|uniref:probable RNA polymerase II nuclear localization protein SLC7A6OS n=1 Tax=Nanorana parkeri TaxID=125878 RepID=UPI0008547155|nr:PREDICTED: probable RNA polymerase II nuclear localization protein SLC7A6OS [Nanorana parkeri]